MKILHLFAALVFLFSCVQASAQWQAVGSPQFTTGAVSSVNLVIGPGGTPAVAFCDGSFSGRASVMRYDGTNWTLAGPAGFSAHQANSLRLAVDKYDSLYVAYSDATDSNLYVLKFDGANWQQAGSLNYKSPYCNLTVDTNCIPSLVTVSTSGAVEIKRFAGGTWTGTSFSPVLGGTVLGSPLIATEPGGRPFVAYNFSTLPDPGMDLEEYNGSNWNSLTIYSNYAPLALKAGNSGTPVLAYNDPVHGGSGVFVGNAPFYSTTAPAPMLDMDIDTAAVPYLLYGYFSNFSIFKTGPGGGSVTAPVRNVGGARLAIDRSNMASSGKIYIAYPDTGTYKLTVVSQLDPWGLKTLNSNGTHVTLSPNPSGGLFTIRTNTTSEQTLYLYDMQGRQVLRKKIQSADEITDASYLDNGVYTLMIRSASGSWQQKLIIAK